MPAGPRGADGARQPTVTERARRRQLVDATIELVAAHGYAACSLQRIADAAGITKGAVIYHFASKNAVIRAAYDSVIDALTERVAAAIRSAPGPAAAVDAYVESMIAYMAENPTHVRVLAEALMSAAGTGADGGPASPDRQRALADLVTAAVAAGEYRADLEPVTLAVIVHGAIDAVVAQTLADPGFDLTGAAAAVLDVLHRATAR